LNAIDTFLQPMCHIIENNYYLGSSMRTAVNHVTLAVQKQLDTHRLARIEQTPAILIVDGVWVEIQYTREEFKEDRSGHLRQCRQAEERVVLAALAVWEDGSYQMLHYEIATEEGEEQWSQFFEHLIERGLNPQTVQLVVSDGTLGLPKALQKHLPKAQQQRCITHKVRGIERYLSYAQLPQTNARDQPLKPEEAKRQRRFEITSEAYQIYEADTLEQAQQRLQQFIAKWRCWPNNPRNAPNTSAISFGTLSIVLFIQQWS
jgi:putative transposase